MRKLMHWVHTSADGYIDGPNGELDWVQMGPELSAYSEGLADRVDTFVYGRPVWEQMSAYWPHAESMTDDPHHLAFAKIWRATPKVVVSRTLSTADHDARVIADNLAEEVAALKEQSGKDLQLTGGSALANELTALGLIDEYHLVVHPLLLGGGRKLFADRPERLGLRLAETRLFDGRSVLLRFDRD